MSQLIRLKHNIKTEAFRLGFTHMGVALSVQPPHYHQYLKWIEAGRHADMTYLSREDAVVKRGDPGEVLKECQRIISLAMPYQPSQSELEATPPGKGRVSAYARTKDYHEVIWEKLAKLEDFIQSQSDQNPHLKSYVDTGPVLERDYAAFAGIGSIGKNNCLIIQGSGSFFFLAEILTDLLLPIDPPHQRDLCGSCRRCIDACPTHCILENRTIDANRCISYLTIEKKGEIADDLKEEIGDWVFGCDVCQNICPHNTRSHGGLFSLGGTLIPEFIDLVDLFSYDESGFKIKFGATPFSRAKRSGLLRNAAIVLGNQKYQKALPVLKQALAREEDPAVKDACRWAIEKIERENEIRSQKG
jgi:epoxyqueuosine reductase